MSSIYKLTETDRQAGHRTGTSKYWDVFASKNKLTTNDISFYKRVQENVHSPKLKYKHIVRFYSCLSLF